LNNRVDVRIPVEGIELDAWLFIPHSHGKKHPAITMAHGFTGTKHHGLERFAKAFCNAGFIVLVHDHRGFGASGGELCQDVNPGQQIADWRRVITYLEALPEVNPQPMGIWGTSYSGGHAIILTANGSPLAMRRVSGTLNRRLRATPPLYVSFGESCSGLIFA